MTDDYVDTVVLNRTAVERALAKVDDVDRRTTVQAVELGQHGASIANLDRSVGYVVEHQVAATKSLSAVVKVTDAIFAQLQIANARGSDAETMAAAAAGGVAELTARIDTLSTKLVYGSVIVGLGFAVVALAIYAAFAR